MRESMLSRALVDISEYLDHPFQDNLAELGLIHRLPLERPKPNLRPVRYPVDLGTRVFDMLFDNKGYIVWVGEIAAALYNGVCGNAEIVSAKHHLKALRKRQDELSIDAHFRLGFSIGVPDVLLTPSQVPVLHVLWEHMDHWVKIRSIAQRIFHAEGHASFVKKHIFYLRGNIMHENTFMIESEHGDASGPTRGYRLRRI